MNDLLRVLALKKRNAAYCAPVRSFDHDIDLALRFEKKEAHGMIGVEARVLAKRYAGKTFIEAVRLEQERLDELEKRGAFDSWF